MSRKIHPTLPAWCLAVLGLLLSLATLGQPATCTGSLGDPIVNVTFGAGQDFGPPLSSNTSDLQYTPSSCPQDGYYGIVNYTSNCALAGGNWHTLTDHTGDRNGYFMMVNASYQPSNFYVQTISGLCDNTAYQFAAWLVNICSMRGILPNITFSIEKQDGTVLQSYNSGDVPITNPATWKQYGFTFRTPPGVTTIILRMRNNAPGGGGNDVALDDITFRPVGASVSVAIAGATGSSTTVCAGSGVPLTLTASVENCYTGTAYQWQLSTDTGRSWKNIAGATAAGYTRASTPAGLYQYRVTIAPGQNIVQSACRTASDALTVTVTGDPHPVLVAQAELCAGDTLQLNPGVFDNYRWQDGSQLPRFTVRSAGTYTVTAGNLCGTATATTVVTARSCAILFPSAFTPDRNGANDAFRILHADHLTGYHLTVFNRWGQKVFETTAPEKGWDGTVRGLPADTGPYVWFCELKQGNATEKQRFKGTLMLLR